MPQVNRSSPTFRLPQFSLNINFPQNLTQNSSQTTQLQEDTLTISMEINEVTYQLVYNQTSLSPMQLCPVIVPGFPSFHYPTHGYYQTQWTWGQFQWPLTVQLHQWTLFIWSLKNCWKREQIKYIFK